MISNIWAYLAGFWKANAGAAAVAADLLLRDHQVDVDKKAAPVPPAAADRAPCDPVMEAAREVFAGSATIVPAPSAAVVLAPASPRLLRPLPLGAAGLWLENLYDIQAALLARMSKTGSLSHGAMRLIEYSPGAPIDAPTMEALHAVELGEQEPRVCEHSFVASRCPICHKQVCDLVHDGPRGWGCDHHAHGLCTSFTPPYDTYRCGCICHCPRHSKEPTRA